MRPLRTDRKLRAFKVAITVVATVLLTWVSVHVVFLARKLPRYKLVPLSTNPAEYSNALARFSNPSALDNVKIPVLIDDKGGLVSSRDEAQIKRLVAGTFWLCPHKIDRIELASTNEMYVVVRSLFRNAESTLFVKKENAKWIMFAGEAK